MAINIFEEPYEKEENRWTANLMKTLSKSDPAVINEFFAEIGLNARIKTIDDVDFVLQKVEEQSIPDAVIEGKDDKFYLAIEMKKWANFDAKQVERHIESITPKPHIEKCLLIITNHYSKPDSVSELMKKYGRKVKISYLSWHNIYDFADRQINKTRNTITKFLFTEFLDFIKEKVQPTEKWQGFKPEFIEKWKDFYYFHEELRKLVQDEIYPFVDDLLKKIEMGKNGAAEKKPINVKTEYISYSWNIKAGGHQYASLEVGFYGPDEENYLNNPVLYVSLGWNRRIHEKIENHKRFPTIKRQLKKNGFEFYDDDKWIEKQLEVKTLLQLSTNKQLTKIQEFIRDCITKINQSGLIQLMRK